MPSARILWISDLSSSTYNYHYCYYYHSCTVVSGFFHEPQPTLGPNIYYYNNALIYESETLHSAACHGRRHWWHRGPNRTPRLHPLWTHGLRCTRRNRVHEDKTVVSKTVRKWLSWSNRVHDFLGPSSVRKKPIIYCAIFSKKIIILKYYSSYLFHKYMNFIWVPSYWRILTTYITVYRFY